MHKRMLACMHAYRVCVHIVYVCVCVCVCVCVYARKWCVCKCVCVCVCVYIYLHTYVHILNLKKTGLLDPSNSDGCCVSDVWISAEKQFAFVEGVCE